MTRVRRRQLLLATIIGAICWIIFSFYVFMWIGLPRPSVREQRSKSAANDDDTRPLLVKFLADLRKQSPVGRLMESAANTSSDLFRSANLSILDGKRLTERPINTGAVIDIITEVSAEKSGPIANSSVRKLSDLLGLTGRQNDELIKQIDSDRTTAADLSNSVFYLYRDNEHEQHMLLEGKQREALPQETNIPERQQATYEILNGISKLGSNASQDDELLKYPNSQEPEPSALIFRSQINNTEQYNHSLDAKGQDFSFNNTLTERNTNFVPVQDVNVRQLPFNPEDPGENGEPVFIFDSDERAHADESWKEHSFNDLVSSKISLERSIPDTRNSTCRHKKYDYSTLPKTSVIICFTDESWSVLLRSVYSVINRTPSELLGEILLVDDFSQRPHLHQPLDDYVKTHFLPTTKVRVIRLPYRHGLIRARLAAVDQTTAEVVTFLDSHVECNVGWLEPLLEAIIADRRTVASPIIDSIQSESFQYLATSDEIRGGFSWNLRFTWRSIPPLEASRRAAAGGLAEPIRTPTIAGGLMSVDRQWFIKLGGYDPGLDVWGGENMELSFKTWMCGGQLLIVPCSRVGHVFRDSPPYTFPGPSGSDANTVARNYGRVADVWMDEYGQLFFRRFPFLRDLIHTGIHDLSLRHKLRKDLNCQSFSWYLDTVYQELYRPSLNPVARGELRHVATGLCMQLDDSGRLFAYPCHGQAGNQYFQLTPDGLLENGDSCVGATDSRTAVFIECHQNQNLLTVVHQGKSDSLKTIDQQCLTVGNNKEANVVNRPIILVECNQSAAGNNLQWMFSEYTDNTVGHSNKTVSFSYRGDET